MGTVATTGDDNSVSYSIKSGNTGNAFTIDGATGEITLSDTSQLDASATGSYTLSVQATDGNTASTQDVTINVTDDVAPSVTSIA
ncbi:cadherin repeat domain-containing protein, partial [Vreelandella titanicae]|uniref:cadherin repeat domain-containing protein n=1 Tax=Vreelandella titanicae TaxID=664683 RepID=UPI0031DE5BFF